MRGEEKIGKAGEGEGMTEECAVMKNFSLFFFFLVISYKNVLMVRKKLF